MMPACFNFWVCQMDSTTEASYAADTSFLGSSPQSETIQDFDTSLLGITVVDDSAIRSDTQMEMWFGLPLATPNWQGSKYPIFPT